MMVSNVIVYLKLLFGEKTPIKYVDIGYSLVSLFPRSKLLLRRKKKIGILFGLEIENFYQIGSNLVLGHPQGITVNPAAKIGDDCTIFKGATIGSIRSGKRKGVPVIGNRCVIGCNAFICGGIVIGDDCLIAANAFVDFDVPSNSLVIGNPGEIHSKPNATKDYLN